MQGVVLGYADQNIARTEFIPLREDSSRSDADSGQNPQVPAMNEATIILMSKLLPGYPEARITLTQEQAGDWIDIFDVTSPNSPVCKVNRFREDGSPWIHSERRAEIHRADQTLQLQVDPGRMAKLQHGDLVELRQNTGDQPSNLALATIAIAEKGNDPAYQAIPVETAEYARNLSPDERVRFANDVHRQIKEVIDRQRIEEMINRWDGSFNQDIVPATSNFPVGPSSTIGVSGTGLEIRSSSNPYGKVSGVSRKHAEVANTIDQLFIQPQIGATSSKPTEIFRYHRGETLGSTYRQVPPEGVSFLPGDIALFGTAYAVAYMDSAKGSCQMMLIPSEHAGGLIEMQATPNSILRYVEMFREAQRERVKETSAVRPVSKADIMAYQLSLILNEIGLIKSEMFAASHRELSGVVTLMTSQKWLKIGSNQEPNTKTIARGPIAPNYNSEWSGINFHLQRNGENLFVYRQNDSSPGKAPDAIKIHSYNPLKGSEDRVLKFDYADNLLQGDIISMPPKDAMYILTSSEGAPTLVLIPTTLSKRVLQLDVESRLEVARQLQMVGGTMADATQTYTGAGAAVRII